MRTVLAPVAALLVLAAGCGTTTTRHDFRLDARTISSIAAEGSLLAGDVADGHTTNAFATTHGGELAASAEELRLTLLRSTAQAGVPARQLAGIAHRVSVRVDAVAKQPPPEEARRLEGELDRLADEACRLESRS